MAVQAQLAGLAGFLPPSGLAGGFADGDLWALRDYGALMSAAATAVGNKGFQYDCAAGVTSAAQSELTCNGGVTVPSRKRGREEDDFEHYVASSSAAALLPFPGMQKAVAANRTLMQSPAAMASTSGRPNTPAASVEDALVSELCRHGAEVDALVRAECDRLRLALEQAHKRQRHAVARAAASWASRLLRAKDAELHAARRRAAELKERLRQAAAESQAWCGVARTNEAVAAGLRAALDARLLRSGADAAATAAHLVPADEGFGDSGEAAADDDDESRCFVEVAATPARRWACRGCGEGEASVLLLPCRHLCLCKACESRVEMCPVCLAGKNAAIHLAGADS